MNSLIAIFVTIFTFLLLVPAAYLVALAVASLVPRRRPSVQSSVKGSQHQRIAVVIPAHNEELLLPEVLKSIANADQQFADVSVFVIADNCSDATARIARQAGAIVAERNDSTRGRGKPFALRWFFETRRVLLFDCDLITIIDADSVVDPAYFSEVVTGFADPSIQVAQGYYGSSNIGASWRAALSEVALCVSHHLRTLGRNALGSTAGLKGNGMVFRTELMLEYGWECDSLVEDLEQGIVLLERGIRVQYLPRAIVRAEMASNSGAAETQRRRWEGGRMGILKSYGPRLLRMLRSSRGGAALDSLLDLITPPLVSYFAILAAAFVGFLLLGLQTSAIAIACACVALVIITLQSMLMVGVPAACWMALLKTPLYGVWKIGFYLRSLLPKGGVRDRNDKDDPSGGSGLKVWKRTARDAEIAMPLPSGVHHKGRQSHPWSAVGGLFERGRTTHGVARASRDLPRLESWRTRQQSSEPGKRAFDVVGSVFALIALSPLLAVVAWLIRMEDRGPIFFRQNRVGHNGRPFKMWKFRSMYTDAEARKATLAQQNQHQAGVTFKMKNDPRITRVGRFIRRFSIDEMPQFLNVLLGDMSLVGPRPPLPSEVAEYGSLDLQRLRVKPGLSCLWQVEGRANIDFAGQVKLDLEYIHSANLAKDFLILLRTVPAVLTARGAY